MPPTPDPKDPKKEPEGNLPDPVMDVLKDLKEKVERISKPTEEKPETPTVPTWVQEREAEKKTLGFTEEQMQAHERMIARAQAPLVERTAWSSIEKRPDLEKYRKEIEDELKHYRPESKTPEMLEKIYFMVKGRHAEPAPTTKVEPTKPRVETTRVSGGPGYSGAEGGASSEREPEDKNEQLDEREQMTADKLGVDKKRFALARMGKDITPLRKPDERPATTGADLELKRLQGMRR